VVVIVAADRAGNIPGNFKISCKRRELRQSCRLSSFVAVSSIDEPRATDRAERHYSECSAQAGRFEGGQVASF